MFNEPASWLFFIWNISQRLRAENRMLRQKVSMLETESSELAERLVRGQVSRADQEETTFHLKRELEASRQRDAENTAHLRELQQRLKHMEQEVRQVSPSMNIWSAATFIFIFCFNVYRFVSFGRMRSIDLFQAVVPRGGDNDVAVAASRAAQAEGRTHPVPSRAADWRTSPPSRDGSHDPRHEESAPRAWRGTIAIWPLPFQVVLLWLLKLFFFFFSRTRSGCEKPLRTT